MGRAWREEFYLFFLFIAGGEWKKLWNLSQDKEQVSYSFVGAEFSRQSCSHSKPALVKVSFHQQMERKYSPLKYKLVMEGIIKIGG